MSDSDRRVIAKLAREARGGLISVKDAADALGLDRTETAKKLAALARRDWIERAKRGLYLIRPLEVSPDQRTVAEDPWIVADEVFEPCYIGGWSAAEYWELTEQIFRPTLVVTGANVRSKNEEVVGHEFRLFRVPESRISGSITPVWRGTERTLVSSPERTIADCLRNPELCGGVRHLAEVMAEYGRGEGRDFEKLVTAMHEVATGAAWKRFGYLAEMLWPKETRLPDVARRNLTEGNARLDPAVERSGKLLNRWSLWVNVEVDKARADSAR